MAVSIVVGDNPSGIKVTVLEAGPGFRRVDPARPQPPPLRPGRRPWFLCPLLGILLNKEGQVYTKSNHVK